VKPLIVIEPVHGRQVFLGPHYVGRDMVIRFEEGESWKKVLGPVFIYLNSGDPSRKRDLWEDAKARARAEVSRWPYTFPGSTDFAKPCERGSVTGRLWVRDAAAKQQQQQPAAMAYVGLAAPGQPGSWARESKVRTWPARLPLSSNFAGDPWLTAGDMLAEVSVLDEGHLRRPLQHRQRPGRSV